MKKCLLSLFAFLTVALCFSQLEPVVSGLSNPVGLAFDGNELYISQVGTSKISKIDVSLSNPTPVDVLTNVSFPSSLEIVGNELYYTTFGGTLSKIDLTDSTPVIETVVSGLNQPFGLARDGDDFYISLRSIGSIVKIDVSQPNPVATTIVSGLGGFVNGIALNGNDLYISRGEASIVSKIDITQSNPVVENIIFGYSALDLVVEGDYLYVTSGAKVSRLNLIEPNSVITDLLTGITTPWGIRAQGTDIYFAQQTDGQISKLDVTSYDDPTLSPDYAALVALYNNTNGNNWLDNTNWLDTSKPLDSWKGLTMQNNRVTQIGLGNNNLTGTLPTEIGDFSELTYLGLWSNTITGTVPPEIGNLTNLIELDLSPNTFSGSIPPEIGNLTNLEILWLNQNGLTGSIPQSFQNLVNLQQLHLVGSAGPPYTNSSYSGDFPDLSGLPLFVLDIRRNYFEFSDIENEFEYYINNIQFFDYSPQYTVDPDESLAQAPGTDINLTLTDVEAPTTVSGRRVANSYQWYKDDVEISGANANSYTITNAQVGDSGVYYCIITNVDFPDLDIRRAPITVVIDPNLSIPETENIGVKFYPNPVRNWLNVDLGIVHNANITISDVSGKLIYEQKMNSNITVLDVSQFPNGMYFLTITTENNQVTKKLIKR